MDISINTVGVVGKAKLKEIETAIRFFADQLMDPRIVKNLKIDVEIMSKLNAQGECVNEDGFRNPRWFTINLKKLDIDSMIRTLGHEMVHVKQYAKNELMTDMRINVSKGKSILSATRWNGKVWSPKRKEDEYFDSPWEIEAYGREIGLFVRWEASQGR